MAKKQPAVNAALNVHNPMRIVGPIKNDETTYDSVHVEFEMHDETALDMLVAVVRHYNSNPAAPYDLASWLNEQLKAFAASEIVGSYHRHIGVEVVTGRR